MTVQEALRFAQEELKPFSDEALTEAKIILSHLADTEPNRLGFSVKEINSEDIKEIITKRRQGVPLQYILGKWWFYKSEFLVGEGVLIPRQDTEFLVETGLELIENIQNPQACDLCSGSGCIAISIALDRPDATVTAVEKYDEAYGWLLKNIEYNGAKNVTPRQADVLDPPFGSFDLILCNPPYIPEGDKEILSAEVLNEPHTALFGGADGLYFYRKITKLWKKSLKAGGHLAFEVGIKEAPLVEEILKNEGFSEIGTKNDLIGIQRVVFGTAGNI